jgi:aspartate kinase
MAVLVQKYGGSSVADVEKIQLVAEKVALAKRAGHDLVVVVSAMGKTTDGLMSLARQVAGDREPPRRELDMLVSTGERVTMALLSIALVARGHEAISFTGSQSGILTNDRHFDARILEVRPYRIEDELARGRIVIVAGYQGMSYRREITTLGRGGSDTTAVALAAALSAERCEIYSDVDGVYSADPRVVPEARHLPKISHEALGEMAGAGAKVLCEQAVAWAKKNGVVIHARKTADGDSFRETIVSADASPSVVSVVGNPRVVALEFAREDETALLAAASALEIPLTDVASMGAAGRALVPLLNVPDWDRLRTELAMRARFTASEPMALVSVVGDGLLERGGLARFSASLQSAAIATHSTFATPIRLAAVVQQSAREEAERALHAAFVGA